MAQGHPVRLPEARFRGRYARLYQAVRQNGRSHVRRHLSRCHGEEQQVQQDLEGQAADRAPGGHEHGHGVLTGQRGAHEHYTQL